MFTVKGILPQRVEHSLAVGPAAQNRLVLDWGEVRPLLQRREEAGDGDHQPGGFQAAGGPEVPAEPHSISVLVLLDELLVGGHRRAWAQKQPKAMSVRCLLDALPSSSAAVCQPESTL